MKYPDWSNPILIGSTMNTNINVPIDGWLYVYADISRVNYGYSMYVTINGKIYTISHTIYGGDSVFVPVKKGDIISVSTPDYGVMIYLVPYRD